MRCCAITKNKWKRCSNQTRFVFCQQHRLGWWLSVVILIFVSVPSVFLDYKDLYNQFFTSDNAKMKPNQLKSYVDLELYQNAILKTVGSMTEIDSTGPHKGRTIGDLRITLEYTGGTFTTISYQQWQPGSDPGTFNFFILKPYADTLHSAANKFRIPNGAFGWTFYKPLQYVLSEIDFAALIGGYSLFPVPFKTLLIRSRSSSPSANDIIDYNVPFKQLDEDEIKFAIFSETLFELNESQQGLKESTVIVRNFDVIRLRNILKNTQINVNENKLTASIITARDNINDIFYKKHKTKLLLLNEERNLLDFFQNANTVEEFSHRVASLGQVSQHLNIEILRSITKETNKEIKSIQLLDKFLTSLGKQSKEISETLKNLNRVRQGYPIHTDLSGNIDALGYFGINYPIKDYDSAWQTLLNSYYVALDKLRQILIDVYLKR